MCHYQCRFYFTGPSGMREGNVFSRVYKSVGLLSVCLFTGLLGKINFKDIT